MNNAKILIVDDDPQIRMVLRDRLQAEGYHVREAPDGQRAVDMASLEEFDLALLDLQMPRMDGMTALGLLRDRDPELSVIVLTAHGTIEHAVEAMKRGAYDFLLKPCRPDHILLTVRKALDRRNLADQNRRLRTELDMQYDMVTGTSARMREVMSLCERVAPGKTTILIGGESGTGKQLLARAIHAMSDRKSGPFVQVTCTTLSEQLMESDLFGHERGAFTGATARKKGRFELAHGGTLFLDEIGDLAPVLQGKLLHVLEYGEFQRVGGLETLRADVRIVAATNKELKAEVQDGRFREDLFYRLNVMVIMIPPLRDRPEDIPVLVEHFAEKHSRALRKRVDRVVPKAMVMLTGYHWPGNIRELENAIERAVVLTPGREITPDLFPPFGEVMPVHDIEVGTPLEDAMIRFKRDFIERTLQQTNNNQTEAARLLSLQRTYLNRLIHELGIARNRNEE
jgi:DNA-binding NtrC family response regulator